MRLGARAHGEDTFYYGRGAGPSQPRRGGERSDAGTREIRSGSPERVSPFAHERLGEYQPIAVTEQRSAYYLALPRGGPPGHHRTFVGVLASKQISLDAVLQISY